MKTLSIRQPWAWLITQGIKTVENRTWTTNYRGELLIHAGKQFDLNPDDLADLRQTVFNKYRVWIPNDLPTGGIVGQVRLVDCVTKCSDKSDKFWHQKGCYAFLLRDARELPFEPAAGRLRLFDYTPQK